MDTKEIDAIRFVPSGYAPYRFSSTGHSPYQGRVSGSKADANDSIVFLDSALFYTLDVNFATIKHPQTWIVLPSPVTVLRKPQESNIYT